MTNDFGKYEHVFDDITPFEGKAPAGTEIDFLGTLFAVSLQIDPPVYLSSSGKIPSTPSSPAASIA